MRHVELRTDHAITDRKKAPNTPDDAIDLHDWQMVEPGDQDSLTWVVWDTGIDSAVVEDHPWFEGAELTKRHSLVAGETGDTVGHGTGVASLIARLTAKIELWDLRMFGGSERVTWKKVKQGYRWLIDNADKIDGVNISWGAKENVPKINKWHDKLTSEGIHVVTSAGNTGAKSGSPATAKSAFSVGATDAKGDMTRFSSANPGRDNPDVAGLGKDVKMARANGTALGSILNDQFVMASGTSFSAPITSAAVANAMYYVRDRYWLPHFESAAPDIPGTTDDGGGLLKVDPTIGADDNKQGKDTLSTTSGVVADMEDGPGQYVALGNSSLPEAFVEVEGDLDGEFPVRLTLRKSE